MKKVRFFRPNEPYDEDEDHSPQNSEYPAFYSKRQWLHPFYIYVTITSLCLLLGIGSRILFVSGLALCIIGLLNYLSLKSLANGISIQRRWEKRRLIEGEEVSITLEVCNASEFSLSDFILRDYFGPSQTPNITFPLGRRIQQNSLSRLTYKRVCDGGMGLRDLGSLSINISDPLGIFWIEISEDETEEVEVFPWIEKLPSVQTKGSPDSFRYGINEVSSNGLSVNFTGVRPYVPGDSLKYIAWKLSTSKQKLLVKEFERPVNSEVIVLLNLDPKLHLGVRAESTWEYAKDIALSIISQQQQMGNTIKLGSNDFYWDSGQRQEDVHHLCQQLAFNDRFANLEDGQWHTSSWISGPEKLVSRYLDWMRPGTNVFYISPFTEQECQQLQESALYLKERGVHINFVFLDVPSFYTETFKNQGIGSVMAVHPKESLDEVSKRLNAHNIRTYIVRNREHLAKAFFEMEYAA